MASAKWITLPFAEWLKHVFQLLAASFQNDQHRVDQNLDIHGNGHVLNVKNVVFEALNHLIDVLGISVFYLSPACNSRTNLVQVTVVWGALRDLIDEELTLGTRSYKRHIAFQYIPELR